MTSSPIPSIATDSDTEARKANARRFLIAIVALLVGGGLCGWMYVHRGAGRVPSDAGQLTNVIADSPPGVQPRWWQGLRRPPNGRGAMQALARRVAATIPDGVSLNGTSYLVRAGSSHLDVVSAARSGQWQYHFSYVNEPIATPAQVELYQAMQHARDPALGPKAGVTSDQLDQLRKVPGGGMVVDNADRDNIAKLFTAWLNAAGRNQIPASSQPTTSVTPATAKPAEAALVTALAALGDKQLAASKQNAVDRAAQIRSILGDAVIAKLK